MENLASRARVVTAHLVEARVDERQAECFAVVVLRAGASDSAENGEREQEVGQGNGEPARSRAFASSGLPRASHPAFS